MAVPMVLSPPESTGAAMATAKMVIGCFGVDRPALAAMIPTKAAKPVLLLDIGANSECRAASPGAVCNHGRCLLAFGAGDSETDPSRIDEHRRGRSEGNELTKEAFPLFKEVDNINFIGNVEGRDVFRPGRRDRH